MHHIRLEIPRHVVFPRHAEESRPERWFAARPNAGQRFPCPGRFRQRVFPCFFDFSRIVPRGQAVGHPPALTQ